MLSPSPVFTSQTIVEKAAYQMCGTPITKILRAWICQIFQKGTADFKLQVGFPPPHAVLSAVVSVQQGAVSSLETLCITRSV